MNSPDIGIAVRCRECRGSDLYWPIDLTIVVYNDKTALLWACGLCNRTNRLPIRLQMEQWLIAQGVALLLEADDWAAVIDREVSTNRSD